MRENLAPHVAPSIGRYCAAVAINTGPGLRDDIKRGSLAHSFPYTELCALAESLIFVAPYVDSPSNRIEPQLGDIALSLRRDRGLLDSMSALRYKFRNEREALVHGDLHTGSVLVGAAKTTVFDLEFAYFGPMALDTGFVFAHLCLARIAHSVQGHVEYCRSIDSSFSSFWKSFAYHVELEWTGGKSELDDFLARLMIDTARFAGAEMIRRIVGFAHAEDIDSLPDAFRSSAQRAALAVGRSLVTGPPADNLEGAWKMAIELLDGSAA